MAIKTQTRNVGPLSMRASFEPASVNAEARTVDLVWTTGARVLRSSFWDGPSYEELSLDPAHVRLDRLNGGAPFLADHSGSTESVMATVVRDSARLSPDKGTATVRFPTVGTKPESDQMFEMIRQGILTNVSVGYRTYKTEKVEGGDEKIPVFRATDWQPFEISAVAMGADAAAGFRSEQQSNNECVFVTQQNRGAEPMEKTPAEIAAEAALAQRAAADLHSREQEETAKRVLQLERERESGITSACRKAGLPEEFRAKLVSDGTSLLEAREAIVAAWEKRSAGTEIQPHIPVTGGDTAGEKFVRQAEHAMALRLGLTAYFAAGAKSKVGDVSRAFKGYDPSESGGELRGYSMADLARVALERAGVNTRHMIDRETLVRNAMDSSLYGRATGQSSSSDFTVLLENIMYKTLLGAYSLATDTWREFCKTDTTQDFRPSNRYRTGSFGVLDKIGEGGEFTRKPIPDGLKQSISVDQYGDIIAITRKAIVNDDMGAIMDTISKFGRSAGLTLEKAVYALLLQNAGLGPTVTYNGITAPLFDAQFGNIGAAGAISMAGLESDRVLMKSQKDISVNEFLDLRPQTLLVPTAISGEAKVINGAKYDPTASSALERPNIVYGLYSKIVDTPRLTGTRRYSFADPGDAAAIVVSFLNGVQAPFMDQRVGWNIDGTEWKLRLDYGVQGFDPKGATTSAGA